MKWLRKVGLIAASALAVLALGGAGSASALVEPNTGQPGAGSPGQTVESNNHCFETVGAEISPGQAKSAQSVFNGAGRSAEVYAGQEHSASLANSNSTAAVSQYDIACVNATRVAAK